ncbi:hypothetical protein [Clostridium saccharoperbutylacetonicum]|uniref:hypothetical protein n=1 Tax=Clostridium saccharoperbutylacetonicum TaxID=36745 RepID=UPI0039E849B0
MFVWGIPIEQGTLESIVRDSLHKYISGKGCILSHEGLDLMAKGIIYTFMALSTDGKSILKQEFDEKIFKWVELNSGGFFKTKDAKAEHEIMFYDKCKHSFYNMMEEVNISEFEGYKSLRDDYIHRISELVRNINKIQLNSHSLEVMKKEKEDSKDDEIYLNTPQSNGLTGFSSDSFKIFDSQMKNLNSLRLWANNRKESYLEKEDYEKEELILELKEILGIEIKKSFFNLGELKRETDIYYFQNNEDKIIGTTKEKVKYEYIEKLDEAMNDYRVLKHFISKISNCSIISLIIKNINSVSDDNITIKIYMPRSVEIFKSSNYELDEILQLVPKRLAEIDGVIEKIFKVKSDSLVMKEKKEREYDYRILKKPFHIPLYSDYNEGYTNKDFYEILENNIKQNVYNDDDEYQVIEYKINKLNPSEIKALGNNIVIYSLKEDIEIKYGITSSNSDGSISGILQLKKLIENT